MEETPVRNLSEDLYEEMAASGLFDTPPEALARLALSHAARDLSDQARSLVPTTADRSAGIGQFVERAGRLIDQANEVLVRAVVYERERGRSWEDIGRVLGITRQSAQERFADDVAGWHDGLDQPYLMLANGSASVTNLPNGAEAPMIYARSLDQWCERHTEPTDDVPEESRDRQVSAHLVDEHRRTRALTKAVLDQGRRLLDRPGAAPFGIASNPVAKRTYWERKVRLEERLAAERPDDSKAQQAAADARAYLSDLRGSNLRPVRPAAHVDKPGEGPR
jgi:hypothetical protein